MNANLNRRSNIAPAAAPSFNGAADPARFWRRSALAAAAVSLVVIGALGSLLWQRSAAPGAAGSAEPARTALAEPSIPSGRMAPTAAPNNQTGGQTSSHAASHAANHAASHTGAHTASPPTLLHSDAAQSSPNPPLRTQPTAMQEPAAPAAAVCQRCGVVENVTAVTKKGDGSGIGAVAGGVLGGVVGHQIGGGSGRTVMTVLGALGGGLAGNEIEKRQRSTTEYRISVRMDDGSQRSFTQAQAPRVGQSVRVENGQMTLAGAPSTPSTLPATPRAQDADSDIRTLQTSTRN